MKVFEIITTDKKRLFSISENISEVITKLIALPQKVNLLGECYEMRTPASIQEVGEYKKIVEDDSIENISMFYVGKDNKPEFITLSNEWLAVTKAADELNASKILVLGEQVFIEKLKEFVSKECNGKEETSEEVSSEEGSTEKASE